MRGLMCQPSSSTAVCMAGGGNSVIVPLRRSSSTLAADHDNTRLLDSTSANYYTRLVHDSQHWLTTTRYTVSDKNKIRPPVFMPSSLKKDQAVSHDENQNPPKLIHQHYLLQTMFSRVSFHCQGCAGKVKKHLSKMEGVISFNIDLENKKVTVMGNVSPVGVLDSKVKKAEFWPR